MRENKEKEVCPICGKEIGIHEPRSWNENFQYTACHLRCYALWKTDPVEVEEMG